jgi:hypothetical protein
MLNEASSSMPFNEFGKKKKKRELIGGTFKYFARRSGKFWRECHTRSNSYPVSGGCVGTSFRIRDSERQRRGRRR